MPGSTAEQLTQEERSRLETDLHVKAIFTVYGPRPNFASIVPTAHLHPQSASAGVWAPRRTIGLTSSPTWEKRWRKVSNPHQILAPQVHEDACQLRGNPLLGSRHSWYDPAQADWRTARRHALDIATTPPAPRKHVNLCASKQCQPESPQAAYQDEQGSHPILPVWQPTSEWSGNAPQWQSLLGMVEGAHSALQPEPIHPDVVLTICPRRAHGQPLGLSELTDLQRRGPPAPWSYHPTALLQRRAPSSQSAAPWEVASTASCAAATECNTGRRCQDGRNWWAPPQQWAETAGQSKPIRG